MSDDLNQIPPTGGSQDTPGFRSPQQKRRSILTLSSDEIPEFPKLGGHIEVPKIPSGPFIHNEDLLNLFKQKVAQLKQDVSDLVDGLG